MKHVIFNKDIKMSKKLVPALRLVNKSWLATTTTTLKKSGNNLTVPIQMNNFTQNHCLLPNITYDVNGRRAGLDQFVATFGTSGRHQDSFLPLNLNLTAPFFWEKNWQSLTNCLTTLGKELIELQITFPEDGGSMPLTFPRFDLHFLRRLSFQFSCKNRNDRSAPWLFQLILNASNGIKELVLPAHSCYSTSEDLIPTNFEFVRLPPSLLSLSWELPLNSQSLKFVLTNPFPNLTTFIIRQTDTTDNDMLFKILHHIRKTLTYFSIYLVKKFPVATHF